MMGSLSAIHCLCSEWFYVVDLHNGNVIISLAKMKMCISLNWSLQSHHSDCLQAQILKPFVCLSSHTFSVPAFQKVKGNKCLHENKVMVEKLNKLKFWCKNWETTKIESHCLYYTLSPSFLSNFLPSKFCFYEWVQVFSAEYSCLPQLFV